LVVIGVVPFSISRAVFFGFALVISSIFMPKFVTNTLITIVTGAAGLAGVLAAYSGVSVEAISLVTSITGSAVTESTSWWTGGAIV
jgi:hypothetical protein